MYFILSLLPMRLPNGLFFKYALNLPGMPFVHHDCRLMHQHRSNCVFAFVLRVASPLEIVQDLGTLMLF